MKMRTSNKILTTAFLLFGLWTIFIFSAHFMSMETYDFSTIENRDQIEVKEINAPFPEEITLSDIGKYTLVPNKKGISIKGHPKLIEAIQVTIKDNKINCSLKKRINLLNMSPLEVEIGIDKNLNFLYSTLYSPILLKDSIELDSFYIKSSNLQGHIKTNYVEIESSINHYLSIDSKKVKINSKSRNSINLKKILADSLEISARNNQFVLNAFGDIKYADLKLDYYKNGYYELKNINIKDLNISLGTYSEARVTVSNLIRGNLEKNSTLSVLGNPKIELLKDTDSEVRLIPISQIPIE